MLSSPRKQGVDSSLIARRVLCLPNYAPIPQHFVEELGKHLTIFPDDTNFIIIPQPGQGFGTIICNEEGCARARIIIPLTKNTKLSDGGRSEGIGSLMQYRSHIHEFPDHKASRRARLQGSSIIRNGYLDGGASYGSRPEGSRNGNLAGILDNRASPSPASSSSSSSSGSRMPVERKRLADVLRERAQACDQPSKVRVTMREGALRNFMKQNDSGSPGPTEHVIPIQDTIPYNKLISRSNTPTSHYSTNNANVANGAYRMRETTGIQAGGFPTSTPARSTPVPYASHIPYSVPVKPEMDIIQPKREVFKRESSISPPLPSGSARFFKPAPADENQRTRDLIGVIPDIGASSAYAKRHLVNKEHISGILNCPCPGCQSSDTSNEDDDPVVSRGYRNTPSQGPFNHSKDLERFFVEATSGDVFNKNATVTEGLKTLGLPDLHTKFPGLSITLMPHQVIGVAWLVKKERSDYQGGLLCDEMGLGKTVQMIALMTKRPSRDPAVKTTLIIAPLALLNQWKLEIEEKTDKRMSVLIYHGPNKTKDRTELQKYDVVLTTYSTMSLEWPDYEKEQKMEEKKMRNEGRTRKPRDDDFIASDSEDSGIVKSKKKKLRLGLLFRMIWYRIILDEAQFIKNRSTRSSRAAVDLNATYRWCLTGTPITNTLTDAYSLLRFIKHRPWNDWDDFRTTIASVEKKSPADATKKLQKIFEICLLRRRKDSELNGRKLVELPEKEVKLTRLEFSEEERSMYAAVEERSQVQFSFLLRRNLVLKNYMHILSMLLRLRQLCSHPALICESGDVTLDDSIDHVEESKKDEIIRAYKAVGVDFVVQLKKKLLSEMRERMEAEKKSADASIENEECPICYDIFDEPVVTRCMHFYCRQCIVGYIENTQNPEIDTACPSCRTPITRDELFLREAFEPSDEELRGETEEPKPGNGLKKAVGPGEDDEEMPDIRKFFRDEAAEDASAKKKGKGKAKARSKRKQRSGRSGRSLKKLRISSSDTEGVADDIEVEEDESEDDVEDSDLSDFIVHTDEDEEEKDERRKLKRLTKRGGKGSESEESDDEVVVRGRKSAGGELPDVKTTEPIKLLSKLLPSTKMRYMMDQLQFVEEKHPEEKTMIVSQWTQNLEFVAEYLKSKNIGYVRFQGDMKREERDEAISRFKFDDDVRVLLMSLKCGGVGLNLTRGNRVIALDLGWSEAVENQAYDRVHRLGQTRNVVVDRLVINNTIEERILLMQERKRLLADGSLGEGDGQKIRRLTVGELANLFNLDLRGRVLRKTPIVPDRPT